MIPVFWLMGLSGSGKSTLAQQLMELMGLNQKLFPGVSHFELLDGDVVRSFLGEEIGYSFEERRKSVRMMGLLAKYLSKNKIGVIVSNISPFHDLRLFMRQQIEGYHEIYCKCSISLCIKRDPKGHYKKQIEKGLKDYIGIDIPFQEPECPDLIIDTQNLTIQDSRSVLLNYVNKISKEP